MTALNTRKEFEMDAQRLTLIDTQQLASDIPQKLSLKRQNNELTETGMSKKKKANKPHGYASGGLKNSSHGNIYQLKLLMLFINRGFCSRYAFLATEMNVAEKFDDLVVRFVNKEETERKGTYIFNNLFLQAKHKQDDNEKITYNDLCSKNKNAEFSLTKYFISYMKIKKNPEFEQDELKDLILCTNINFDERNIYIDERERIYIFNNIDQLKKEKIEIIQVSEPDNFLKFNNPKKSPAYYKLKIGDDEIQDKDHYLYKRLLRTSDLQRLAKELANSVSLDEKLNLTVDIFKLYHIALIEEKIIDNKAKKFHDDFINNQNLSSRAKKFRSIFLKDMKTIDNEDAIWEVIKEKKLKLSDAFGVKFQCKDIHLNDVKKFAQEIARYILEENNDGIIEIKINRRQKGNLINNIDKLAGHILVKDEEVKELIRFRSCFFDEKYKLEGDLEICRQELKQTLKNKNRDYNDLISYRFKINNFKSCVEAQLTTSNILPDDEIQDEDIDDYFKKLIFAVNQPNEIELGEIITKELGEEFNLKDSDFMASNLLRNVLDWMKAKEGVYLTEENAKQFFDELNDKISKLALIGATEDYRHKLREVEIEFVKISGELSKFLMENDKQILIITAEQSTKLGAIKVDQALESIGNYKQDDSCIFILSSSLLPLQKRIDRAFSSKNSNNLLVIEFPTVDSSIQDYISDKILPIVNSDNPEKKIILIINKSHRLTDICNVAAEKYIKHEVECCFNDLTEESQQWLLAKEIKFQGEIIALNQIIGTYLDFKYRNQNFLGRG